MKKISLIAATLVGAAVLCAAPISLHQAQDKGLSLSVDKAQAYYGHYRRVHRRARPLLQSSWLLLVETYRVIAVGKLALRRASVAAHAAAFSLLRPRPDHEGTHHAEPLRHEPCPHVLSLRLVRGGARGSGSVAS